MFASTYTVIFIDQFELEFLKTQNPQSLVWFKYIDGIYSIWTYRQVKLDTFIVDFKKFHPNLKFTPESRRKNMW